MNWLKKVKDIIIKHKNAFIVVLIAILSLIIVLQYNRGPEVKVIQKENSDIRDSTTVLNDINEKKYAKMVQLILTNEEKDRRIDSLAKALRVKPKFVTGASEYITKTEVIYKDIPVSVLIPM